MYSPRRVYEQELMLLRQVDTEESPIDLISITVAQRYSVLVTARNDTTASNWAIHANMDTDMFDTIPDALNPSTSLSSSFLFTY